MSTAMGFGALIAFMFALVLLVPVTISLVMLVPMVHHLRSIRRRAAAPVQLPTQLTPVEQAPTAVTSAA